MCPVLFALSKEDDKDDEEDDEDKEDLDHKPAVGGDRLEVFEDLCVGRLHVQLGVLHISIDPAIRETGGLKWMQYLSKYLIKQIWMAIKCAHYFLMQHYRELTTTM